MGERRRSESSLKWAPPARPLYQSGRLQQPPFGGGFRYFSTTLCCTSQLACLRGIAIFFFFTRGFTKCKFPPNPPPPLGARKPSSYTPGTGLGSPSGSRRNPGPSTPARRALLTAPAAGGPEGSVTEPGSHLPGLFPPRFSEPRATQLSSPQGRQSKFLRGSEEHWLSALLPPFPCLPPPHTSGLGGREVSSVLTRDHPTTVFPQGVPGSGPP